MGKKREDDDFLMFCLAKRSKFKKKATHADPTQQYFMVFFD